MIIVLYYLHLKLFPYEIKKKTQHIFKQNFLIVKNRHLKKWFYQRAMFDLIIKKSLIFNN